jgi:hypothetical protein
MPSDWDWNLSIGLQEGDAWLHRRSRCFDQASFEKLIITASIDVDEQLTESIFLSIGLTW